MASRWESTSTIMCPEGPGSSIGSPWVESTSIPPSADETKRRVVERVLKEVKGFTVVFDSEAARKDRLWPEHCSRVGGEVEDARTDGGSQSRGVLLTCVIRAQAPVSRSTPRSFSLLIILPRKIIHTHVQ